jgi:hypothetical protein
MSRRRVHVVMCDVEGCPAQAPAALHAAWAITAAKRAGWARTRELVEGRWYARDYCPDHRADADMVDRATGRVTP